MLLAKEPPYPLIMLDFAQLYKTQSRKIKHYKGIRRLFL